MAVIRNSWKNILTDSKVNVNTGKSLFELLDGQTATRFTKKLHPTLIEDDVRTPDTVPVNITENVYPRIENSYDEMSVEINEDITIIPNIITAANQLKGLLYLAADNEELKSRHLIKEMENAEASLEKLIKSFSILPNGSEGERVNLMTSRVIELSDEKARSVKILNELNYNFSLYTANKGRKRNYLVIKRKSIMSVIHTVKPIDRENHKSMSFDRLKACKNKLKNLMKFIDLLSNANGCNMHLQKRAYSSDEEKRLADIVKDCAENAGNATTKQDGQNEDPIEKYYGTNQVVELFKTHHRSVSCAPLDLNLKSINHVDNYLIYLPSHSINSNVQALPDESDSTRIPDRLTNSKHDFRYSKDYGSKIFDVIIDDNLYRLNNKNTVQRLMLGNYLNKHTFNKNHTEEGSTPKDENSDAGGYSVIEPTYHMMKQTDKIVQYSADRRRYSATDNEVTRSVEPVTKEAGSGLPKQGVVGLNKVTCSSSVVGSQFKATCVAEGYSIGLREENYGRSSDDGFHKQDCNDLTVQKIIENKTRTKNMKDELDIDSTTISSAPDLNSDAKKFGGLLNLADVDKFRLDLQRNSSCDLTGQKNIVKKPHTNDLKEMAESDIDSKTIYSAPDLNGDVTKYGGLSNVAEVGKLQLYLQGNLSCDSTAQKSIEKKSHTKDLKEMAKSDIDSKTIYSAPDLNGDVTKYGGLSNVAEVGKLQLDLQGNSSRNVKITSKKDKYLKNRMLQNKVTRKELMQQEILYSNINDINSVYRLDNDNGDLVKLEEDKTNMLKDMVQEIKHKKINVEKKLEPYNKKRGSSNFQRLLDSGKGVTDADIVKQKINRIQNPTKNHLDQQTELLGRMIERYDYNVLKNGRKDKWLRNFENNDSVPDSQVLLSKKKQKARFNKSGQSPSAKLKMKLKRKVKKIEPYRYRNDNSINNTLNMTNNDLTERIYTLDNVESKSATQEKTKAVGTDIKSNKSFDKPIKMKNIYKGLVKTMEVNSYYSTNRTTEEANKNPVKEVKLINEEKIEYADEDPQNDIDNTKPVSIKNNLSVNMVNSESEPKKNLRNEIAKAKPDIENTLENIKVKIVHDSTTIEKVFLISQEKTKLADEHGKETETQVININTNKLVELTNDNIYSPIKESENKNLETILNTSKKQSHSVTEIVTMPVEIPEKNKNLLNGSEDMNKQEVFHSSTESIYISQYNSEEEKYDRPKSRGVSNAESLNKTRYNSQDIPPMVIIKNTSTTNSSNDESSTNSSNETFSIRKYGYMKNKNPYNNSLRKRLMSTVKESTQMEKEALKKESKKMPKERPVTGNQGTRMELSNESLNVLKLFDLDHFESSSSIPSNTESSMSGLFNREYISSNSRKTGLTTDRLNVFSNSLNFPNNKVPLGMSRQNNREDLVASKLKKVELSSERLNLMNLFDLNPFDSSSKSSIATSNNVPASGPYGREDLAGIELRKPELSNERLNVMNLFDLGELDGSSNVPKKMVSANATGYRNREDVTGSKFRKSELSSERLNLMKLFDIDQFDSSSNFTNNTVNSIPVGQYNNYINDPTDRGKLIESTVKTRSMTNRSSKNRNKSVSKRGRMGQLKGTPGMPMKGRERNLLSLTDSKEFVPSQKMTVPERTETNRYSFYKPSNPDLNDHANENYKRDVSSKVIEELHTRIEEHKDRLFSTKHNVENIGKERYDFSIKMNGRNSDKIVESTNLLKQKIQQYSTVAPIGSREEDDKKVRKKLFEQFYDNVKDMNRRLYSDNRGKKNLAAHERFERELKQAFTIGPAEENKESDVNPVGEIKSNNMEDDVIDDNYDDDDDGGDNDDAGADINNYNSTKTGKNRSFKSSKNKTQPKRLMKRKLTGTDLDKIRHKLNMMLADNESTLPSQPETTEVAEEKEETNTSGLFVNMKNVLYRFFSSINNVFGIMRP